MIKRFLTSFLASAAWRAVRREKPTIVAVTGSYGKSSAKEAIAIALGASEPGSTVRASIKNYNNEFGVPFTIFNVPTPGRDPFAWIRALVRAAWVGWGWGKIRANTLVLEMGADRKGDLAWLVGIARPDVSVITAVGEAHSEFFGSVEEIAKEKSTLVRALPEHGFAVLNNDDARVTAMRRETSAESVYFGFSDGSDVQVLRTAPDVTEDERRNVVPQGLLVSLAEGGRVTEIHLRGSVGQAQAWAVAAAFAVALRFKVPPQTIAERLEHDYHGIPGRTRVIPAIKGATIIDDSYNAASPRTVVSALRDLAHIPLRGEQRRIAAIGDMRELGSYSESAHREVGRAVVENGIDVLVACGTLARVLAEEAQSAGLPLDRIRLFQTSAEAGRFLQDFIRPGDLILVKGSQGMRMERIVKELMAEPNEAPFLLVRMSEEWQKI